MKRRRVRFFLFFADEAGNGDDQVDLVFCSSTEEDDTRDSLHDNESDDSENGINADVGSHKNDAGLL